MISEKPIFKAYVGLGTNLGLRLEQIEIAYQFIEKHVGNITRKSSLYETEAWGLTEQNSFLNTVVEVHTSLYPFQLLEQLLHIEEQMGRKRTIKWGPRVIDLDIIAFENWQIHSSDLTIPHAYMQERKFVLVPFLEIAPLWRHPNTKKTVQELIEQTTDTSNLTQLDQTIQV